jgi:hypothetical protein
MSSQMSKQYTGKSPFLKKRIKKVDHLLPKELTKYRKLVDACGTIIDAAEKIQLHRETVSTIYDSGEGHGLSIKKIRSALKKFQLN